MTKKIRDTSTKIVVESKETSVLQYFMFKFHVTYKQNK